MSTKNPYLGSLSILTSLFFMWGFITCLNDILIPQLKSVFMLSYTEVMLVQFCFFAAYLLVSLPSGYFVEKFNYQIGIITGLSIAGTGCLLFYLASVMLSYALFLFAFFILASGITLLQVAANPLVTLLGPPETASSRLTLTQAFNSLGTTLAPYFGTLLILTLEIKSTAQLQALDSQAFSDYQHTHAQLVQQPYLWLSGSLFLLALSFFLIKLPEINPTQTSAQKTANELNDYAVLNQSAWHYRHLILGAVGIFVYVGAEVSIGSFLISYLGEPEIAGLPAQEAGKYVTFYWGGAMLGRFIGASLMQRFPAGQLLALHALAAMLLTLITLASDGTVAMWSILAIGLFNSIMFPTIFALALNGLGEHTGQGSGILCMAIVGGALVPVFQGVLADRLGLHTAFILPALCYGYIAFYGWIGSRFRLIT